MNILLKVAVVLIAVPLFLTPCVGQVVEDDAAILDRNPLNPEDYDLVLAQTTSGAGGDIPGLFSFFITELGNHEFQFDATGIAEFYGLFFAMPGDRITPSFVTTPASLAGNVPFSSNYYHFFDPRPNGILTLAAGESVFFGYWDDRSFIESDLLGPDTDVAGADDNYGWLELGRSDRFDGSFGQLEILGGATAIGRGIVVGTTTTIAIPEPSATLLMGLASVCAVTRRRRTRRNTQI